MLLITEDSAGLPLRLNGGNSYTSTRPWLVSSLSVRTDRVVNEKMPPNVTVQGVEKKNIDKTIQNRLKHSGKVYIFPSLLHYQKAEQRSSHTGIPHCYHVYQEALWRRLPRPLIQRYEIQAHKCAKAKSLNFHSSHQKQKGLATTCHCHYCTPVANIGDIPIELIFLVEKIGMESK